MRGVPQRRAARTPGERRRPVHRLRAARARPAAPDPPAGVVPRPGASSTTCSPRTASTTAPMRAMVERHVRRCPPRAPSGTPRARARPLPPLPAADVHGDGAHRRGLGARRAARRPRLQDRAARTASASRTTAGPGCRLGCSPRRGAQRRHATAHPVRVPGGRGRRRPGAVRARRRRPRGDRGGAARRRRGIARDDEWQGVADARGVRHVPLPVDLPRQRGAVGAHLAARRRETDGDSVSGL